MITGERTLCEKCVRRDVNVRGSGRIMGYLPSLFGVAVLLPMLVLFHGTFAFAQDPPNVGMGMSPTATYHSVGFDSVDMSTGRLQLYIPLVVDQSQRGKLNFTYSISYTSTGTWSIPYGRYLLVEPPKYGPSTPSFIVDGSQPSLLRQFYHDSGDGYGATADFIYENGPGAGPLHPLGTTGTTMETIDGSGFLYNPTLNVFTNREGTQFGMNGTTAVVKDANGNEMTAPYGLFSGITTDTLGRSWITNYCYSSCNVSGCPTGGLVAPTMTTTWTIPGPTSSTRIFKLCYSVYNVSTSFNTTYGQYSNTASPLTGIVLPDGSTWRFDYDNNSYLDLIAVYPPTGGHISYSWTTVNDNCSPGTLGAWDRIVASRTIFDGVNSNVWTYLDTSPTTGSTIFTVTDPLLNDTVYTGIYCTGKITQIQSYVGTGNAKTLLKTITKGYQLIVGNPYPCDLQESSYPCGGPPYVPPDPSYLNSITTTWPNGQQKQELITDDSALTFTDTNPSPDNGNYTASYGLMTVHSFSDYGQNPLPILSTTTTGFWPFSHPSYITANILNLPSSVVMTNVNGYKCSETDYAYDATSQIISSGVTEQHVSAPTAGVLGNLTSITQQLYTNPCQSANPTGTPLTTNRYVYDTGMLQKSFDPLTNATTYSYASTYYGAYPTSVCNALSQCTTYVYDFNSGLMTSMKDPNNQTTSWVWDCMLRNLQANYPDGGQESVTFNYSPSNGGCGSSVASAFSGATLTEKITSALNKVVSQTFDGLGRTKQTKASVPTSTCPSGTSYVDTTYDGNGRQFSVSNPYCTTGEPTYGLTKTYYDPLSRPCLVVPPDGTAPSSYSCQSQASGNDVVTSYLGNATTVTDQAGNQRHSLSDGLGRLIEVDEPGLGSGTGTYASGVVGIYGTEQANNIPYTWDTGTVSITINSVKETVSYGQGSTPTSLATALASAFNADNNSFVTASANGIYITLTSKATGTSSNYPITVGASTNYPNYFSSPSFTASPASPTLNCGSSGSTTVYSICTPAVTTYAYDALGDLTQAAQAGSYQRTFVYDSLSRLTQATNPESETTSYVYDANGNVLTKTDARGITISYSPSNATIDPLNRVRGKTYSNGEPEVTYGYDGTAPAMCSPMLSTSNPIGRRTGMCDAAGNEAWSYDSMGRVAIDQRTTNGITKSTTYGYNLDSSIGALSYPSLRTITYTPNSAAQTVSAKDTAYNINYVVGPTTCPNGQTPVPSGGACYTPQGSVARLVNGSNLTTTSYFNNRLQLCRIAVSNNSGTAPTTCGDGTNTGNVLDYGYSFDLSTINASCLTSFTSPTNSGDVASITNKITTARSQYFCYDPLNRILQAETVSTTGPYCWGEQYSYDKWANLLSITGISPQYNGCTQESGFNFTGYINGNNQITASGFTYDAAGDMTHLPSGLTASYNAEGRLCSVGGTSCSTGTMYSYDGNGNRVEKLGSTSKLYWYGTDGNVLDESDSSGNMTYEYVFFGGERVARRDSSSNVDYYFTDHLGTARIVTNSTGTLPPLDDSDFYPFGVERPVVGPSSGNTYKFVGKERDTESGLDNFSARYDSSQYGRFMSPDPSGLYYADPTNPQSFNLYSYVLNNPLNFIDPTGQECVWDDGSYDSADDKDTGDRNGCARLGGTYFNPAYFSAPNGDWSDQADANLASVVSANNDANNGICTAGAICSTTYDDNGKNWFTPSPAFDDSSPTSGDYMLAIHDKFKEFPEICTVGVTARVGAGNYSAGADLNSQDGLRFAARQTVNSPPPGAINAGVSVRGKNVSTTLSVPIPETPFSVGASSRNNFRSVSSVNAGVRLGKYVNAQVYGTLGQSYSCKK